MRYGLIGKSLSHSYSKAIHGFFGNAEYGLLELPPHALEGFLRGADFRGINVTIPYKEAVMPFCEPDAAAREIGCVNTIVNRGGRLLGYNTDYFGFSHMAKSAGISFEGKKALILGSGGTSKTAACAARAGGAREIAVVSRGGESNYGNLARHADSDVLINTTPVGMFPGSGSSPVSLEAFPSLCAVIDVVYNPLRTRLMLGALERGIPAAGGLCMLVAQALMAHRLFFGAGQRGDGADLAGGIGQCGNADRAGGAGQRGDGGGNQAGGNAIQAGGADLAGGLGCGAETAAQIAEALSKAERLFSNIALVGMPGCGKTTVGRKLASLLGMAFADTDLMVEESSGRKIPDIIRESGEPFFRALESAAVAKAAAQPQTVIATGGGAVLSRENRDALLQNGKVVFLERPLSALATEGRPLSADLKALLAQRLPIYEALCHFRVAAAGSPAETARRAAALFR